MFLVEKVKTIHKDGFFNMLVTICWNTDIVINAEEWSNENAEHLQVELALLASRHSFNKFSQVSRFSAKSTPPSEALLESKLSLVNIFSRCMQLRFPGVSQQRGIKRVL